MKKIHFIQHVPFETPGCILDWAQKKNLHTSFTHLYKLESLPNPADIDFVVIMGGPMGVHDTENYACLADEEQFIIDCLNAGKKILGICLGAQIIAKALGAIVFPNEQKEIGWFPINLTKDGKTHALLANFPQTLTVFQWHGDTFTLPQDAIHLVSSAVCQNQAFLYKDQALAIQFHLEVKPENINNLLVNCADDLILAPFVQNAHDIVSQHQNTAVVNPLVFSLLDKFFTL